MKICQVSAFFAPHTGGSERYAYELSKYIAQRGHEVHVYTSRLSKSDQAYEEKDGICIHRFVTPRVMWGINPLSVMMQGFLDEEFDVIHAHSYIFASSNQAALARLLRKTPLMLHLHGGIDAAIPPAGFSDRFKIYFKRAVYDKSIGRFTMGAADMVASVSKKDLQLAGQKFGVGRGRLRWIPNAVDTTRFHNGTHIGNWSQFPVEYANYRDGGNGDGYKLKDGSGNGDPAALGDYRTVVFIGRLEHWKGIMTFLKVAERITKHVKDVEFIVIGGGSLLSGLLGSGKFSNGRIRILGPMPHEKIAEILQKCEMMVLPSFMEGLPTVCLESLASEVPIVASNVGGVSEVVIENETGLLIPPGDVELCTKKVETLLKDEDLRLRMGRRGRVLVEQYYTWDRVTSRVQDAYQSLVSDNLT